MNHSNNEDPRTIAKWAAAGCEAGASRRFVVTCHAKSIATHRDAAGFHTILRIEEGLRREIREELGHALQIGAVQPWTFRDDIRTKLYPDGSSEQIHMIYLIFDCEALNRDVTINEEFDAHAWVEPKDLGAYDLNAATRITLLAKGLLPS